MTLFERMKKIKDRVRALLLAHPHLRDNDHRLVATYHKFEADLLLKSETLSIKTTTALELLEMYAENKLTSSDAITRVRRKLQETERPTRGKLWAERHAEAEVVRTNIHDL